MRKTIAILGSTGDFFLEVMEVLLKRELRLLLVSRDEEQNRIFKANLQQTGTLAEVDFTSCERDGCWEADIIVITRPKNVSSTLLERIKEVATQKIVLVATEEQEFSVKPDLRELLPWSKVVEIKLDKNKNRMSLCSNNAEAKAEVQQLFEALDYQLK